MTNDRSSIDSPLEVFPCVCEKNAYEANVDKNRNWSVEFS
jgi:hypothetical protein